MSSSPFDAERVRVGAPRYTVNWGKSYPGGRGEVEFVQLQLPKPTDITLYLGQPSTQMFEWPGAANYRVSVGCGGTSFDYLVGQNEAGSTVGVASSVRGNVLHFVCDRLFVRGNTSDVVAPAADIPRLRFAGQAGLGRPQSFQRAHQETPTVADNSEVLFVLTPWSTHARINYSSLPVPPGPSTADWTVRQINRGPAGDTDITGEMPYELYRFDEGCPLHPWCNVLALTTTTMGPAATFTMLLTETLMY